MNLSQPPALLKSIYPSLEWLINTNEKQIFLTFDDGPTPGVTDKVLDLLKKFNSKATFFCVGKNIVENPQLFDRIIAEGHRIGNHTFNHLNGWKTKNSEFLNDVGKFQVIYNSKLFRPPYGRMKPNQIKSLKKEFRLIMWSILSLDYDQKISSSECSKIAISNWQNGSIIVFHDSLKAEKNMFPALNKVLEKAKLEGWETKAI